MFCNFRSHLVFNNLLENPYYSYLDRLEPCHYTTTTLYHHRVGIHSLSSDCAVLCIFLLFSQCLLNWDESCKFCSDREFFTECACFFFLRTGFDAFGAEDWKCIFQKLSSNFSVVVIVLVLFSRRKFIVYEWNNE